MVDGESGAERRGHKQPKMPTDEMPGSAHILTQFWIPNGESRCIFKSFLFRFSKFLAAPTNPLLGGGEGKGSPPLIDGENLRDLLFTPWAMGIDRTHLRPDLWHLRVNFLYQKSPDTRPDCT